MQSTALSNLQVALTAYRKRMGMTQVQFAEHLGVAKSTLSAIERGHSPTLGTLEVIANGLGVSVAALVAPNAPQEAFPVLMQLLDTTGHFSRWSARDRCALINHALQIVQLVEKYSKLPVKHAALAKHGAFAKHSE